MAKKEAKPFTIKWYKKMLTLTIELKHASDYERYDKLQDFIYDRIYRKVISRE